MAHPSLFVSFLPCAVTLLVLSLFQPRLSIGPSTAKLAETHVTKVIRKWNSLLSVSVHVEWQDGGRLEKDDGRTASELEYKNHKHTVTRSQ